MWYTPVMETVTMHGSGRLTVPASVRKQLGLTEGTELEIEVDAEKEALVLRRVVYLRLEDAWAYTPEHRELLEKAHKDSKEGRVKRLREEDLESLGN